jgi:dihydrofolate reductase
MTLIPPLRRLSLFKSGAENMALPLSLIVAVARNGVIGGDNKLLWRLSSDLKRFKALTMGKPLIMGRKTWDSIGRALPGRESIIVTRDHHFRAEGVHVVHNLSDALRKAEECADRLGADEAMVIGGAELYRQMIDQCRTLYVTEVEASPQGDAHFVEIDRALWREVHRERHDIGPQDEIAFSFVDYRRQ